MAYMNQEKKKKIAARLKSEFPNWSFRLSVRNHSSISVKIVKADIDFLAIAKENQKNINPSRIVESGFKFYNNCEVVFGEYEEAISKLQKFLDAVNLVGDEKDANYDRSDFQSDYFNVGYYTYFYIGGYTDASAFKYVPTKN